MVFEHQALDQRKTFLLHNMPSITREKETIRIALYNCKAWSGRGCGETRAKRNKSALCQASICILYVLDQHKNTAVLQFFKTSTHLYHVLVVKWFKKRSGMVSVNVRYLFYQPIDEKTRTWTLRFPAKNKLIWRRHCSIGQSCCSMTSKQGIDWILESSRALSFFTRAFA